MLRNRDNGAMARTIKPSKTMTGLYYAREARGVSRAELGRRTGITKQQLSRLEGGHIRLRLDHLKPFANVLGYSPEQILLWGRYPGTSDDEAPAEVVHPSEQVPELASRSGADSVKFPKRKDGRHVDRISSEGWFFPSS